MGAVSVISLIGWRIATAPPALEDVLTAEVKQGDLVIEVNERGDLMSANSTEITCEIEGGGKLISIVPEGTRVNKGDEVCRIDTEALDKRISEQEVKSSQAEGKVKTATSELEVQKNKGEGEIAKAELALKLARLDHEAYRDGEAIVELKKRQGAAQLGEKELKEAEDNLEFTRRLVKKGLTQFQQLKVMELATEAKRYVKEQQQEDVRVFNDFVKRRKITELEAKEADAERELRRVTQSSTAAIEKAESELAAAERTAKLESNELERLTARREKYVVTAPSDGIVIHSKRFEWDENSKVRPGAEVFYQQPLFSLPDLDHMKVKVRVHESIVKKVSQGQTSKMLIEALPNRPLYGKVIKVASVPESTFRDLKEYPTEVSIDDLPADAGLKPGMTAEVTIHIRTIENALAAPVQSVMEAEGKHVCYVVSKGKIERREIKVGDSNTRMIQIVEGVQEGEKVTLDARSRVSAELKKKAEATQSAFGAKKDADEKNPSAAPTAESQPNAEPSAPKPDSLQPTSDTTQSKPETAPQAEAPAQAATVEANDTSDKPTANATPTTEPQ